MIIRVRRNCDRSLLCDSLGRWQLVFPTKIFVVNTFKAIVFAVFYENYTGFISI